MGGSALAKLSDFGAAFYYGPSGSAEALAYERMEVRAFGLLLDELLQRHDGVDTRGLHAVRAATAAATATAAAERPAFTALHAMLTSHDAGGARRKLRPRSTFGRVLP